MKLGYKAYFRILRNIIILGAVTLVTWGTILFILIINQIREFNKTELDPSYIYFASKVSVIKEIEEQLIKKPLTFFTDFEWKYACFSEFRHSDDIGTKIEFYEFDPEKKSYYFTARERFYYKLENKILDDKELCFNKNVILQFNKEKNTIFVLEH